MIQYIISYDNGESYEDHSQIPICVVPTEARAKARIAQWLKWVDAQRAKMPEEPDPARTDEVYEKQVKRREAFWGTLKPPHQIGCLVSLVSDEYNRGCLVYDKIKSLS